MGGNLGFKCAKSTLGMSIKSSQGAGDGIVGGERGPPPRCIRNQDGHLKRYATILGKNRGL